MRQKVKKKQSVIMEREQNQWSVHTPRSTMLCSTSSGEDQGESSDKAETLILMYEFIKLNYDGREHECYSKVQVSSQLST